MKPRLGSCARTFHQLPRQGMMTPPRKGQSHGKADVQGHPRAAFGSPPLMSLSLVQLQHPSLPLVIPTSHSRTQAQNPASNCHALRELAWPRRYSTSEPHTGLLVLQPAPPASAIVDQSKHKTDNSVWRISFGKKDSRPKAKAGNLAGIMTALGLPTPSKPTPRYCVPLGNLGLPEEVSRICNSPGLWPLDKTGIVTFLGELKDKYSQ